MLYALLQELALKKKKTSQVMSVVLALAFPCPEFINLVPIKIKWNSNHGEIDKKVPKWTLAIFALCLSVTLLHHYSPEWK